MTDDELEAIKARWNWNLTDALPQGSEAKADVRALIAKVEQARDVPDFDGDDVYAADEVACPHCGQTMRVTMRATLSAAGE